MKKKDYILRTDLALQNKNYKRIESISYENVKINTYIYSSFHIKDILLFHSNLSNKLFVQLVSNELKFYFKKYHLKKQDGCLVVGLGNASIASDSLGVKTVSKVKANGYLEDVSSNIRKVYTYLPGVIEQSGYMAFKGIEALVKELKPSFLLIIDSFVSDSVKHLNQVIQFSDMGITPGSGLANYQAEISLKTLGIPVFVIGVPTATYASTIIRDAINSKENHISFLEGYDFVVASKDIDLIVEHFSKIISASINQVLNNIKPF